MTSLIIHTPEGVQFRIPLAGPAIRFLAWLIDLMVIGTAITAAARALRGFQGLDQDLTVATLIIIYFLLNIGYPITLEWLWRGQTIGKRLFALRVIDAGGKRLEFTQILLRNLLRFVDSLPCLYLVGGAALVLSKHSQRLGDLGANTVVIRQQKLTLPGLPESVNAERFNSLLDHPHLAARLRQSVSPALAHVAMEAILRRDELTPSVRIAVFKALAQNFRVLVNFPDETIAGLADERYVRNCLQVVFTSAHVYHSYKPGTK